MKQTNKSKTTTVIVSLIASIILLWSQPGTNPSKNINYISSCGEFPRATGDGGPTSRYYVCQSNVTGECYYKKAYFEEKKDCTVEKYEKSYGQDNCFTSKTSLYSFEGVKLQKEVDNKNICEATTQNYFESKVNK